MSLRNSFCAAALLLLASCAPKVKETTLLRGQLPAGLDELEIHCQALDTLLKGEDGRFEISLPTNLYDLVTIESGPAVLQLVADGTALDIVLADSSTVSSRTPEISLEEKFSAFLGEVSAAETPEDLKKTAVAAINAHKDDVVGAAALQMACLYMTDEELGQALRTLSSKARSSESMRVLEKLYNSRMETSEGCHFRDFTVNTVSGWDYGVPLRTKVSLSDYAGMGQFTLLFFWNSRDKFSVEQVPYIQQVWKKYGKKGMNVVSVSVGDQAEESVYASSELGMDWVTLNSAEVYVLDLYGAVTTPLVVYIAPDGTILNRDLLQDDIVNAADHYYSIEKE